MGEIFNTDCRQSLSLMLAAKMEEEKELQRVKIASFFSMIHVFNILMGIFNILLCTVIRVTTFLWFKNICVPPSSIFIRGNWKGRRSSILNEAFLKITEVLQSYIVYIKNKSFSWLFEMIDITVYEMHVLCKVFMLFFSTLTGFREENSQGSS